MKENILQICHCFLIIVLLFSGKTTSQFYFFGIEWTIRLWKWNVPLSRIGSFRPISHDSKVSRIGFKMVSCPLEVIWLVLRLKGVTILCTVCWAALGTGCCTDRLKRIVQVPGVSYGNIWLHALYSVYCKWIILPAGEATRHIPSAKAVVAPLWVISAPNYHISKWNSKIPVAVWEAEMRALPLSKMQTF